MKLRSIVFSTSAVVVTGIALAHHVPVPLSYVAGPEILTEIVVRLGPTPIDVGVPAYKLAQDEHEHHVALADGDTFYVIDGVHAPQPITFHASQFADIGDADEHEVVDAINAQVQYATAFTQNSFFGFRGLDGGPLDYVRLEDGAGSPLSKLQFDGAAALGRQVVDLVLSIPLDEHGDGTTPDLVCHPYLLLASHTDGSMLFKGAVVPIGRDSTTVKYFRAATSGQLNGFVGQLDANEDAAAALPVSQLVALSGSTIPDKLYFAYVVMSLDGSTVEYVSNRFTIDVEP